MNIEQFIAAAVARHTNVREQRELCWIKARGAVYSAVDRMTTDDAMRDVLYFDGVLNGIEQTVELVLGKEKMEEVLDIEPPDANLVAA